MGYDLVQQEHWHNPVHCGNESGLRQHETNEQGLLLTGRSFGRRQIFLCMDDIEVAQMGAVERAPGGGVAGAVLVTILDSDTSALIGDHASVNQNTPTAGAEQNVNVSASNDVTAETIGGSLGIGLAAGVSGGVDVGFLRNDTKAFLGSHATVSARQDVDVNALSRKDVDSLAISASGGSFSLAGSVSVWTIGGGRRRPRWSIG